MPPAELGPDPHARGPLAKARAYATAGFSVLPQVLGAQWLPPAALQALVTRRLRALVRDASASSPYYRDALASVAGRIDRLSLDDLREVPLLDKAALRDHEDRLLTRSRDGLMARRSSGSSGVPVTAYFDPLRELPRRLQELRFLTAHGFRPWHSQLILDAPSHLAPRPFALQRAGLWRREALPAGFDGAATVAWVRERQLDFLGGVLSGVKLLATLAERAGGLGYQPRGILTKGELLDPSTRWFLERTFSAPVIDYYAIEEVGIIAWQCPAGSGYHVDADLVWLEVLADDGSPALPGEVGELVVTNLYQRAMPMIRFRTGDLGILDPEPCRCGRGLPVLRELHGRRIDCIRTPDGVVHDPFRVISVMEAHPELRWFRFRQTEQDALTVELSHDPDLDDAARAAASAAVLAELGERLGPTMRLELIEVNEPDLRAGSKNPIVIGLPSLTLDALAESDDHLRL